MSNNSCNIRMTSKAVSQVTMPSQPTFLAFLSSTVNNVTGDNTPYTLAADSEVFDQGSDYNNTTYTFTAPVNGNYLLSQTTKLNDCDSPATNKSVIIGCSTTSYGDFRTNQFTTVPDNASNLSISALSFIPLSAGDTVTWKVFVYSSAGTKTVDVYGANPTRATTNGVLLL